MTWETVLNTLVENLASIIIAVGGFVIIWRKQEQVVAAVAKVDAKTDTVIHATNGLKAELVEATAKASSAEGRAAGRAEEKAAGVEAAAAQRVADSETRADERRHEVT